MSLSTILGDNSDYTHNPTMRPDTFFVKTKFLCVSAPLRWVQSDAPQLC